MFSIIGASPPILPIGESVWLASLGVTKILMVVELPSFLSSLCSPIWAMFMVKIGEDRRVPIGAEAGTKLDCRIVRDTPIALLKIWKLSCWDTAILWLNLGTQPHYQYHHAMDSTLFRTLGSTDLLRTTIMYSPILNCRRRSDYKLPPFCIHRVDSQACFSFQGIPLERNWQLWDT